MWKLLSHVWLFVTPWNSPGQNTGVGSLSLLQRIFLTQGSNPGFPHCRWILYQLSHKGSPRILEWVAYPFSSGSSWPRNRTRVSCIAGGFLTDWVISKAQKSHKTKLKKLLHINLLVKRKSVRKGMKFFFRQYFRNSKDMEKKNVKWSRSVMSDSLRPHGLYSPWNSPGQNTGVGSLSIIHGIFPTQGSNSGFPHCRWILYQLNHQGSPSILEWAACPFSSGSSWPRNRTRVSCIAGGFFINWAIREVQSMDL